MVWPWRGSEFGILRKKKKMSQFETWCEFFCERKQRRELILSE